MVFIVVKGLQDSSVGVSTNVGVSTCSTDDDVGRLGEHSKLFGGRVPVAHGGGGVAPQSQVPSAIGIGLKQCG